jgi:hypothetical protein
MPELIVFDSTDKGTLRLDEEPLESTGDKFVLIKLPHFGWEIYPLENTFLDDLITLFIMYYISEIMDMIVEYTNNYIRELKDNTWPYSRANEWYLTNRGELYVFFTI